MILVYIRLICAELKLSSSCRLWISRLTTVIGGQENTAPRDNRLSGSLLRHVSTRIGTIWGSLLSRRLTTRLVVDHHRSQGAWWIYSSARPCQARLDVCCRPVLAWHPAYGMFGGQGKSGQTLRSFLSKPRHALRRISRFAYDEVSVAHQN